MYTDSDMQENKFILLTALVCVLFALSTTAPAQTNLETNVVSVATNIVSAETNVVSEAAATNTVSPPAVEHQRGVIDEFHHDVCSNLVAMVKRFDRFFQDPSLKEENNDTRISVGLGISWSRKDHAKLANEISARIALPNLQQRLQIIADNFAETDNPESLNSVSTAARESRPDTGLRYIFSRDKRFRFSADAGLRVGNPSEVFGKLRERYTVIPVECWELRLTQTVQWYSLDGFAESSTMRWSRMLKNDWLFQAESDVRWDQVPEGVTPSQVFAVSKEQSDKSGYRWIVSGVWPETPNTTEAVYTIEHGYRRLVYSDWLFLEFRPGVEFPQVDRFHPNPKVTLLFDCVFAGD
jgi:hypothetical protein